MSWGVQNATNTNAGYYQGVKNRENGCFDADKVGYNQKTTSLIWSSPNFSFMR